MGELAFKNVCLANETLLNFSTFEKEPLDQTAITYVIIGHLAIPFIIAIIYWLKLNRRQPTREIIPEMNNSEQTPETSSSSSSATPTKNQGIIKSKSCIALFKHFSPPKVADQLNYDDMQKILCKENRESQEDGREYDRGGYMPMEPGQVLNGAYEVFRKLGFGHFSTVWLCKDLVKTVDPKFVAIKVCKSADMFTAVANDEIRLLTETKQANPDHPGYKHIVQMVDTFKLISFNGIHTAIALEIMGPSLLHLLIQSEFKGIQVPGVRRITQQIILGLTYLHDECHIIHTDIKPENILIKVKESYVKQMAETAGRFIQMGLEMPRSYISSQYFRGPSTSRGRDTDDKKQPEKRAQSYPFDVFLADICKYRKRDSPSVTDPLWINPGIEIKIADMGNACWETHHFASEIQTRQYRALEVILGANYSYPADIWSVGCLAFELATGELLFGPRGHNSFDVNVDHLSLIWETLGGIPKYITETGAAARVYFTSGKLRHIPADSIKIWKIEDVLVEKYKWKRVDAIPFAGFLESCIEPDPALRLTAANALANQQWLNDS